MEQNGVLKSSLILSEAKDDDLCEMYFGISRAIFCLKSVSEKSQKTRKCSDSRDKLLIGSAHLLGMLVWGVQNCDLHHKLESCKREIMELKIMRSEDAKANEKVASIYATQEQSWFFERKKLRNQIGTLLNDMRILDRRKSETISELNGKLVEMSFSVKSKEKILEEAEKKRRELKEKVKSMEDDLEELREKTKCEAESNSAELLKQKTAFIELVSNQREIEAELGRALRQGEATKEELDYVFEEKEEALLMVQELTVEVERVRKESEWKDKILSVMMRKSKLEEARLLQSKRNGDHFETDRWRGVPGGRIGRRTLRNMLSRQNSSKFEVFSDGREADYESTQILDIDNMNLGTNDEVLDDFGPEVRKQLDDYSLNCNKSFPEQCYNHDEAIQLDEWVHLEAERYHNAFEKRHQLELDSITEQMHLKHDKLEACRWRLLSTEVKSKKLLSQIECLNNDLAQLRHQNFELETLLVDREVELKTMKDQIALQLNHLSAEKTKVKLIKKNSFDKEKTKKNFVELESVSKDSSSTFLSPAASVDEKEALQELHPSDIKVSSYEVLKTEKDTEKVCLNGKNGLTWKVDIHALGVSYKIKRLNQQLLMLDRLTGKKESSEVQEKDEHEPSRTKGFSMLLLLLNKHVRRYQSLQEKTDDLSKRMGEKNLNLKQRGSNSKRTKEETRKLENFLEETFQLQRFVVATGQKLIELQSKIASGLDGIAKEFEGYASFDMKRFTETIQSLFKDVQRGLEVRVSQILGDLGGTLTCDGIHFRK